MCLRLGDVLLLMLSGMHTIRQTIAGLALVSIGRVRDHRARLGVQVRLCYIALAKSTRSRWREVGHISRELARGSMSVYHTIGYGTTVLLIRKLLESLFARSIVSRRR